MENKLILDLETSGLPDTIKFGVFYDPKELQHYENSRIIEIGFRAYIDEDDINDLSCLIIPDNNKNFEIKNSAIHGISTESLLKEGKKLSKVLSKLEKFLDKTDTIIGHNIQFDINILLSECYRINNLSLVSKIKSKKIVCTMQLGKALMKQWKNPKLTELYKFLFKENIEQQHRALDDVILCVQCYRKIKNI
jgi:DNA polymerase III epsilon subunit-like protein